MIGITINFPKGLADKLRKDIAEQMESVVYPKLREVANRELDKRIDDKDSPYYKAAYTVSVDGKAAVSRDAINRATYWVRITFVQAAINVAVGILKQILSSAIRAWASPQAWINRESMAPTVRIFYGGVGQPVREISSASEIEAFIPGDFICVTPSFSSQVFSNTKKFGAAGYMAKAARRIRARLKITQRDSPLVVRAGRSRAVFERMGEGRRPDGSVVQPTRPHWGAWAIFIRYRSNTTFR